MCGITWWGEGTVKRGFPLCISPGGTEEEGGREGCGSTCPTGKPPKSLAKDWSGNLILV